MLACVKAQRVYGAARGPNNEHTRNTHTPLILISGERHWKDQFLVQNILFLLSMSPEMVWWWLLLRRASLLGSTVDSKQCHEQFVTPLSCFPLSRCNSSAFRTPILLHLLLSLDTCGGVDSLGVFPLLLKMVADIICTKQSIISVGSNVWIFSRELAVYQCNCHSQGCSIPW